jgi:hypothetical protein
MATLPSNITLLGAQVSNVDWKGWGAIAAASAGLFGLSLIDTPQFDGETIAMWIVAALIVTMVLTKVNKG